ncbi:hypothetical protein [Syntrophotalea acetylenica]|uniref:Plasmid stabilization system n=1 Tax=Syntrophotalea acetylenica TaxID=29542 RepID=A0A1L3GIH0_SYNAC|nr:hypothetical protein [Syntrophotalea acetylenica]APG25721.1 hypothetical protein A7E75_12405 [Syntrophotalea acetylenica]APG43794.1 hypothetical protein A6070_06420 [Syntrophotalea acetylenica]
MSPRPLKRSLEYKGKVREYARNLAGRYRPEIAGVFLKDVGQAEKRIFENNEVGSLAPYIILGEKVVLRELYFSSGPAKYCLVYHIDDNCLGLVTLWHGSGIRKSTDLIRLWE